MSTAAIPRYLLYGERDESVADRFIHIETIARRSGKCDWTIRPHSHAALDHLFVVTEGGGEMRVDSRRIGFDAAILTIPAGAVHAFRFRPGTVGHVVTIAEPLMCAIASGQEPITRLRSSAHALPFDDPAALAPILTGLTTETEGTAPLAALASEALLRMLLITASRQLPHVADEGMTPTGRATQLVARFRKQIDNHLREGWSLFDYTRDLGISSARLRAACGEVAGVAPIRILHERLLAEARRQLSFTDRAITDIAYDLGFRDPAYFSRFFRRGVGVPPRIWRINQTRLGEEPHGS